MSKYISRTKSKIIFKENAEKEIGEKLAPASNKILADIMRRREEFRKRQIERAHEREKMIEEMRKLDKPVACSQNPALDEYEKEYDIFLKEYDAFIAEQKRIKAEREANEVKNDVASEEATTSENSEEIQIVETKPKKRRKKKKVVETTETLE